MNRNYYRPEIDGLRAIAVLSVIFSHADMRYFQGGFIGVDIFFVISGFLITNLLMVRFSNKTFSYTAFFIQRIRRLFPALIFMLAVTLPFFWKVMMPDQFKTYVGSIFSTSVLLSNFYFLSQLEYWQSDTDLQPLAHMWSLSIEEQYYLLYPGFLMLISRLSRTWILAVLLASTFLGLIWALIGITDDPGKNYFHSFSRFWQLGFGCTLAIITLRYKLRANALLATFGLLIILASVLFINEGMRWPSTLSLFPMLGTVLFIGFANKDMLIGRILSFQPILYTGLISYSLYLWHQPIFAAVRTTSLHGLETKSLFVSLLFLFLISSFSFHFIEKPIRYSGKRKPGRSIQKHFIAIAMICIMVITSSSLWAYVNIVRINDYRATSYVRLQERLAINTGLSENCYSIDAVCRTSTTPKILVWGDSYAMHLVPALTTPTLLTDFEQRTMSGCPPYLGYGFASLTSKQTTIEAGVRKCIDFNEETLRRLESSTHFKHIIISSPFLYTHEMFDSAGNQIDKNKKISTMQLALSTLVEHLNTLGLQVTIVSPPPRDGNDKGLCVSKLIRYGYDENVCNFPLKETKHKSVVAFLRGVNGDFDFINLDKTICPKAICRVYQDEKIIYRDAGHLSIEGSPLAAEELRRIILNDR